MEEKTEIENKNELSETKNELPETKKEYYRPSIKRLRIILMFFMCINLFGFPTAFGGIIQTVCGLCR